jgi:hypothetical protein
MHQGVEYPEKGSAPLHPKILQRKLGRLLKEFADAGIDAQAAMVQALASQHSNCKRRRFSRVPHELFDQTGYAYQVAALVCFVVFADNVLSRLEGQPEAMFLSMRSSRPETIIVFGMLSVSMQFLFWSTIVDPGNRRTRGG